MSLPAAENDPFNYPEHATPLADEITAFVGQTSLAEVIAFPTPPVLVTGQGHLKYMESLNAAYPLFPTAEYHRDEVGIWITSDRGDKCYIERF